MKLNRSTYRPFGLEPIETASRDEIAALQTARLKRSLHNVYENVPAYRKKFDAAGVNPADFKRLEDLAKFPFTTKQDLRENYPFGLFAVPEEKIARVHASSGTTGKPTVVGYTRGDLDTWADLVARSIRAGGGRPGMTVHIAVGYGLFTGGLGMHYGAERLGCTVIPVASGMTERQVQLILDFKPDIIIPTPSYLLVILDEFRARSLDPGKTSLKLALCGAEPWTDAMRMEIERAFDIDAVDTYGLSELLGPGMASECIETKDGPHIWEDHFYPEIIEPQTGKALPDGERGELVFTSLTREAMPVIRYRTRDLTRLLPGQRALDAADGAGHRQVRRHDDCPRRQCVPDPDRGTDIALRWAGPALCHRAAARRAARSHARGGRGTAEPCGTSRPRRSGQTAWHSCSQCDRTGCGGHCR